MTSLQVIARARNGYMQKFGIPRQAGCAVSVFTRIVFEPAFRIQECLRGIESYSHLWLLWGFSENKGWSPTVRPPRLGGNKRIGVFATRSPFRPNGIGLSAVRLERVETNEQEGHVLVVSGADLMDGTPIYDIKPYLPYADCLPEATAAFAPSYAPSLEVCFTAETESILPYDIRTALREILSHDPRPAYQQDAKRLYRLSYARWDIGFRVEEQTAKVVEAILRPSTDQSST